MSRIAQALARRKGLIAYLTVGYPSVDATLDLVPTLAELGCDMVELGIPFSDPLADGTTIQRASYQALQNGVTPELCLSVASELRHRVDIPLAFMTYYNPVLSYGPEAFSRACAQAGIDGLIVPDLPPEEGLELQTAASHSTLDLIYLLAPTSGEERIELAARNSSGFIYIVSVAGVTGARQNLPQGLDEFVGGVRARTPLPLCVGFGISDAQQAARVARVADGVIVGSRLIQIVEGADTGALHEFIGGLRQALDACQPCANSTHGRIVQHL